MNLVASNLLYRYNPVGNTWTPLANMPGHPAIAAARIHKARCEQWLLDMVTEEGHADAETIARALMVLIDGAVSQILIHRDAKYATSAGFAVRQLMSKGRPA